MSDIALSSDDRDIIRLIRTISVETIYESAKTTAINEELFVLIVYGPIPASGYIDESHRDIVNLVSLTQRQGAAKTAVYLVLRREEIGRMLDDLEDHNGYRAMMIDCDGDIVQGYQL